MKRIDEFETKLDSLLEEFEDVSYDELGDSLEYYANMYQKKARIESPMYEALYYMKIINNSC